jgi:hypothetical protein
MAGRRLALKGAITARAAFTLAVAAAAFAMVVVPGASYMTGRRVTREIAILTLVANALSVGTVALVVVTAGERQQRQETEQIAKADHQLNRTL